MGLVGAWLGRAARFAPLPVVLVPPKNLLDHGIDDVVRVALDEPSVIFEEFVDRLLEPYLPSHDPWCFLNDRHSVPPLLMCGFSKLPVTLEKTVGPVYRAAGQDRPHQLFGTLNTYNLGSAPPVFV